VSSDSGYGVGIGALTFDWYYIRGSSLTTPFWATLNMTAAGIFWGWLLNPLLFSMNVFGKDQNLSLKKYHDGSNMHVLNSAALFNSTGQYVSAVSMYSNPGFDLDLEKYNAQAPIYISTYFALTYAGAFLAIIAAFTHVFLWHSRDIFDRIRRAYNNVDELVDRLDIHNLLMKAYPEVSDKAFLYFLILLFVFQYLTCTYTSFVLPLWSLVLVTVMSMLSIIPIGIITAISGQRLGVNVLTEFVIGYLIPGKTISVMAFKSLGTNSVIQAITLLSDLKLGHYMKIDPRYMIFAQIYGSLIGAFINVWSSFWVMDSLSGLLGTGEWRATNFLLFYNAGAIWGAIGPNRFFGPTSVYHPLLWCFPLGLILPVIPWYMHRKAGARDTFWKHVNVPLLANFERLGSVQNFIIIPTTIAWFFQKHMKESHQKWWQKYNYILAIAVIIINF
jgi:OPT family oligopeptide transporter